MYNHTDANRQMTVKTKKGMKRVSPKKKPNKRSSQTIKKKTMKGTHTMPDGNVMSGAKHNKDSKPVKRKKPMGKAKKTISY